MGICFGTADAIKSFIIYYGTGEEERKERNRKRDYVSVVLLLRVRRTDLINRKKIYSAIFIYMSARDLDGVSFKKKFLFRLQSERREQHFTPGRFTPIKLPEGPPLEGVAQLLDFPRHRLRLLEKLGEGDFGMVSIRPVKRLLLVSRR